MIELTIEQRILAAVAKADMFIVNNYPLAMASIVFIVGVLCMMLVLMYKEDQR